MAYPESIDKFAQKLNKLDNNTYVIEEEVEVINGVYEGELEHDNISLPSINVYTGSKLTGDKIENIIVSTPSLTPWKNTIKIFSDVSPVYITYQTTGDTVEAEDINKVQDSVVNTQNEVDRYKNSNDLRVSDTENRLTTVENSKADKTYVDTELNKRYLKTETYNKEETDQRIQNVVGAAPEALDTLKEIADSLGDDKDFAGTMTKNLSTKVDKIDGKQLSTEDYTSEEKGKLAGIETGANKYIHPTTHPASIITGLSKVAESNDYGDLDNKPTIPTTLPANGGTSSFLGNAVNVDDYSTLNPSAIAQGNITPIKAPNTANSPWNNTTAGFLIQSNDNDSFHILIFRSGGDGWAYRSYYQGAWSSWKIWSTFDGNYNNLSNRPSIPTKTSQLSNDSKFITQTELGNAGYGDMMKSTYDKDNDGIVDKAEDSNTLGGKSSSDFAPSGFGLGGAGKRLGSGINANTIINNGWYDINSSTNLPSDVGTGYVKLLVICSADTNYITQIAFSMTNQTSASAWIREKRAGSWSSWSRVLTSSKQCTWNDLKGV